MRFGKTVHVPPRRDAIIGATENSSRDRDHNMNSNDLLAFVTLIVLAIILGPR